MSIIPYIVKFFRGGISDESDKGIQGSFKYGYQLDIHGKDDVLKAGSAMAVVDSTTTNDLINFFVTARDGTTYAFGNAGSVYAIAGDINDPAFNFVYNDENGEIKGAAEWKESDGNNYLYWATSTSVARRLLNGSPAVPWGAGEATQDYKTTLDATRWHTMGQAAGNLYIANGENLAEITYAGAFDPAAVNIRPGNQISSLEERDDNVILGSERLDGAEKGHVWRWDTTSTNYNQKRKIPVKGVNALIQTELFLLQGGNEGEIFFSDFINATPVHAVPGGGQVNPGGVEIEDDLAVFGIYGSGISYPGIWSFGRRNRNRPLTFNHQYRISATNNGSGVSSIGALGIVDGKLIASWGTTDGSTSDYGIDIVSATTRATGVYEGLEFDASQPHVKKTFQKVKVVCAPLESGTSFSIKFKLDKESTWRYAVLASGSTTFSEANQTEAVFLIGKPGQTYEVGAELNPSGSSTPEIHSIVTYVEGAPQTIYG